MVDKIIDIVDFSVSFDSEKEEKKILKKINVCIKKGESVGIVGPSGCGKSLLSLACLNLLPKNAKFSGNIFFYKKNNIFSSVFDLKKKDILSYRGSFSSIVFQDPFSSLNPVYTCGYVLKESFLKHKKNLCLLKIKKLCFSLLKEVGLKDVEKIYKSYPHQLSGGQLQRVLIASSLALYPKVILADEPTTALDPSIKKEVLNLLYKVVKKRKISLVLISHDISVIKNYTDYIYILKDGYLVESGSTKKILNNPKKEFTKNLIFCKPLIGEKRKFLPVFNNNFKYKIKTVFYNNKKTVLSVNNVSYKIKNKEILNNISFSLFEGECLGLVGESGSGKSTIAKVISGLIKDFNGSIFFNNKKINNKKINKIQLVFQDSLSSLNPKYKVGDLLYEVCFFYKYTRKEIKKTILSFFKNVGLDNSIYNKYPHQLSGGQKQRISITRILLTKPDIIIFDESLSALDLITQANILNLIKFLKNKYKFSLIFISHDLGSISFLCDYLIVLNKGKIVDKLLVKNIKSKKNNIYTKQLINDTI